MAWLGWTLRTSFLPLRLSAPQVNRYPHAYRTQWKSLCATKAESSSASPPKALEDITVVDSTRGAVRAAQILLELPLERRVSWKTQLYKPSGAAAIPSEYVLSASAFAGDDVDFGNGPHLFISGNSNDDAEIWKLLRRYFESGECGKVWFDYSSSMRALALKEVHAIGFSGEIVNMARLYRDRQKKMDIDVLAKAILTKGNRAKSYSLWEKNNLPVDQVGTRLWEAKGKLDDPGITAQWVVRACYDASLTYRLDERLRQLLIKAPVHGDAYNTTNGTSTMNRNEDVFNLLQSYETYFRPLAEALHAIEGRGLPVDFGLWEKVANEDRHRKRLLEDEFRRWASTISNDALYMNLSSAAQLRQVLFAPCENIHNKKDTLGPERSFEVKIDMPETESTKKSRNIVLKGAGIKAMSHTKQGWPSTSIPALREALDEYTRNPSGNSSPEFPEAMESLLESMAIGRRLKWYANQTNLDSIAHKDGRIRMGYKTDFYTGRLLNSSAGKDWEPIMQQCISPGSGNYLIHVQYPDLEMWTLAQLSGCASLRGRMDSESNAGLLLAYELFLRSSSEDQSTSLSQVSHEQCHAASMLDRAMGKGGDIKIVESLVGCGRDEAMRMTKTWYDLHPGVLKWKKEREGFISEQGFAETYMGRRRKVRRGRAAEGIEFIVNGTAAEIVMGGIIGLRRDERISALGWHTVHADRDVIVLEGPHWSAESILELLEDVVYKPTGFELDVLPQVIMYLTQGEKEKVENMELRTTEKD